MDADSIDQIRRATFSIGRKGYEKREVEHFLNQLADWLETGGGDQARTEAMRRELERIGEKTSAILTEAHAAAQALRDEAEREAEAARVASREEADRLREEAEAYAAETREAADRADAEIREAADRHDAETRTAADEYSRQTRDDADDAARGIVADAEAKAERIVAEGSRRRRDVEAVISDLIDRRDSVLADIERLTGELSTTVGGHAAASFEAPDELDPQARPPRAEASVEDAEPAEEPAGERS